MRKHLNLQSWDDGRDANSRDANSTQPPVQKEPARKRRYLLPILLVVAPLLCCGTAVLGYFLFGVDSTSDPALVRAALDGITDVQLPPTLEPHIKSAQITGVETVEFRSRSGKSYLIVTTGPRFRLNHSGTLRESADRGTIAGGGRPESPTKERTIKATVRGQPAEFIYRCYSSTETISGYFQGKQNAVHLEGQLSLRDFSPGTAVALVESIR
jgi:hypothetical protein